MDIIISQKIDKPIYQQLYDQIVSQIISGVLCPDYCLPSIRTIAVELNISVITIKKAWEMLEQNGFIYTVSGKGCFVKPLSNMHLEDKKYTLAAEQLKRELPFYKSLGISEEELHNLISKLY